MTTFINARIITPHGITEPGSLCVEHGKIVEIDVSSPSRNKGSDDEVIDAQGMYLAPGFIDIHVHGGGGSDFMDNELDGYVNIAQTHARYGTTAMLPTTLTSDRSLLMETFQTYQRALDLEIDGAQFYGLHLEGPYFAMAQRGAQDPRYIRDPDPAEYEPILRDYKHLIARWSAAPELPGALEFGKYVTQQGIL